MGTSQSSATAAPLGSCMSSNKIDGQFDGFDDKPCKTYEMSIESLKQWMPLVRQLSLKSKEPFEARVERYASALTLDTNHMKKMVESFVHELEAGLIAHARHPNQWIPAECSFKMLDACIPAMPTGGETGLFYALDFGGTNFRVVRVELHGEGKLEARQYQGSLMSAPDVNLPGGLLDSKATASQIFDFFAQAVEVFMKQEGDYDAKNSVAAGFTFSFPCAQRRIDSAILMEWTKGFATGRDTDDPVEGLDVAELMNVALVRSNLPMTVNSVVNDTIGTLLSCAYSMDQREHPPCLVGMILGTGMNCCYVDERALEYGYMGKAINIECGNFNRDLPRTNIDCEIDFKEISNRGFQQIEKMCSGAYLGEITRLTLVKIFQHRAPPLAWENGSLTAEDVSRIMNDRSKEFIVTRQVMTQKWEASPDNFTTSDLQVVHRIATLVMDRSAGLAAVLIAGCSKKSGRLQAAFGGLSVGIDGSLYKKNGWYRERVRFYLDAILGESISSLIHLLQADDGSGKGAAILAALVASKQQ